MCICLKIIIFFYNYLQIDHVDKLKGLETLVFTDFVVAGNPFVKDPYYVKQIRQAFPVVKKIVS